MRAQTSVQPFGLWFVRASMLKTRIVHQAVGINGRKLSYLWRLFAWSYEATVAGALIIVSHQGITHSALANRMAVVVWGSAF